VPQLKALLQENERSQREMDAYVGKCERLLCRCLRDNQVRSTPLAVHATGPAAERGEAPRHEPQLCTWMGFAAC
jgi:hypothetical protein